MKTLYSIVLLSLFVSFTVKSQNLSSHQKKLEKALKFITKYELDSAETILKEISTETLKTKDPKTYIRAQLNLGRLNGDKGSNVIALQYYQNAMKIAEKTDDKEVIPHILKNMGVLFVSWKKFDQAFNYYDKAEQLARELDNEELVADCNNNKGIIYEQLNQYDKALDAYKTALELYIKKQIPGKIAMSYSNIAIVYKFQKKYNESIKYNLKSIAISEIQDDKWSIAATYNNIGNLYGEMGNYPKAIEYCNKALAIAKEIDAGEIIESTYDSMAEAAAKVGDYKNAFLYHKLFSESMSKFMNKENTRQLTELNIKYESEKKQNLINQQEFQIKQKNNWIIFIVLLFLVSLITVFLIYKNYRHKQNRKLQKEIFKQQELETKALFEGEQNERIRIARDLHDSVGQMLSLVKMNLSSQEQKPETENIQNLVDKTIAEVRSISHNLIPEELSFGIFPALENLAEKINHSTNASMEINMDDSIQNIKFQKQNELSIYRIVQEVINNMIKHSNASKIQLSITKIGNNLKLNIEDNGTGMDTGDLKNSKGIGWKNVNARINMMDGKLKINSEKLKGTLIEITLPQYG